MMTDTLTIVLLLISSVFIFDFSECLDSKLLMAQIIFRHGDRNIIHKCPNDPWLDEKYWPGGYNQLTNAGKQRQFRLGTWLRKRYQNLFPNGYSPDNTYVLSTDVDRTLMSAASNLAGLFPPVNNQSWNESLNWQPIPIHTVPEHMDPLLASLKPCPLFDFLFVKNWLSNETKTISKKFEWTFPFLSKFCGRKIETLNDACRIYDILLVERQQNKTLPAWSTSTIAYLEEAAIFVFKLPTATPQLARLKGGFLIKHILDIFTNKTEATLSPNRTFFMYSGHDNTIVNVLNSLGLFDSSLPPYAACILFELHEADGDYYVKMFYKKTENEELPPLEIPNCGTMCPLKKFYEIYDEILPKRSYDDECSLISQLVSMGKP